VIPREQGRAAENRGREPGRERVQEATGGITDQQGRGGHDQRAENFRNEIGYSENPVKEAEQALECGRVDDQDIEERPLARLQGEPVVNISGVLEPGVGVKQTDNPRQSRDQKRDRPENPGRKRGFIVTRGIDIR